MVKDNLPSRWFLFEYKREDSRRIAATSLAAGEMEVTGDHRVILPQHANLKAAEFQLAHGLARRIASLIAREDHLIAMLDRFADEGCLRRIVVTTHKRDNVTPIPGAHLIGQNLTDGILARLRPGARAP